MARSFRTDPADIEAQYRADAKQGAPMVVEDKADRVKAIRKARKDRSAVERQIGLAEEAIWR